MATGEALATNDKAGMMMRFDAEWWRREFETYADLYGKAKDRNEQLEAILRVLVEDGNPFNTESNEYDSWLVCQYCRKMSSPCGLESDDDHRPDCTWLTAKALVAASVS